MKGMFITFEGGEGCGKSTLSETVYNRLIALGYSCVKTREPGGVKIAEQIRNILLDTNNTEMSAETEALLYAAARTQHTKEKIQPAVEQGKIVLCDRYIGSSFAYQGHARQLGTNEIATINDFGIHGYRPDIQFFINAPVDVALARVAKREQLDRLELEDVNFHLAVHDYFEYEAAHAHYVVQLDGILSVEELADIVVQKIIEFQDDSFKA